MIRMDRGGGRNNSRANQRKSIIQLVTLPLEVCRGRSKLGRSGHLRCHCCASNSAHLALSENTSPQITACDPQSRGMAALTT
jgi:hypothetical protein